MKCLFLLSLVEWYEDYLLFSLIVSLLLVWEVWFACAVDPCSSLSSHRILILPFWSTPMLECFQTYFIWLSSLLSQLFSEGFVGQCFLHPLSFYRLTNMLKKRTDRFLCLIKGTLYVDSLHILHNNGSIITQHICWSTNLIAYCHFHDLG